MNTINMDIEGKKGEKDPAGQISAVKEEAEGMASIEEEGKDISPMDCDEKKEDTGLSVVKGEEKDMEAKDAMKMDCDEIGEVKDAAEKKIAPKGEAKDTANVEEKAKPSTKQDDAKKVKEEKPKNEIPEEQVEEPEDERPILAILNLYDEDDEVLDEDDDDNESVISIDGTLELNIESLIVTHSWDYDSDDY